MRKARIIFSVCVVVLVLASSVLVCFATTDPVFPGFPNGMENAYAYGTGMNWTGGGIYGGFTVQNQQGDNRAIRIDSVEWGQLYVKYNFALTGYASTGCRIIIPFSVDSSILDLGYVFDYSVDTDLPVWKSSVESIAVDHNNGTSFYMVPYSFYAQPYRFTTYSDFNALVIDTSNLAGQVYYGSVTFSYVSNPFDVTPRQGDDLGFYGMGKRADFYTIGVQLHSMFSNGGFATVFSTFVSVIMSSMLCYYLLWITVAFQIVDIVLSFVNNL